MAAAWLRGELSCAIMQSLIVLKHALASSSFFLSIPPTAALPLVATGQVQLHTGQPPSGSYDRYGGGAGAAGGGGGAKGLSVGQGGVYASAASSSPAPSTTPSGGAGQSLASSLSLSLSQCHR